MRAAFIFALLAPIVAVSAQSSTATSSAAQSTPSGITPCISDCSTIGADAAGCSSFADLACICVSTVFMDSATACLQANCTAAEVATAQALDQSLCAPYLNSTSSIIESASSAIASASSAAQTSVSGLTASAASTASVASVSATHTTTKSAAEKMAYIPGSFVTVAAVLLGVAVGPIVLFA